MLFRRGFILKPVERAYALLKNAIQGFQKSPPFERSVCFHAKISVKMLFNFIKKFSEKRKPFSKNWTTVL